MSSLHLVLFLLVIQAFSQVLLPTAICVNAALENQGRLFLGGVGWVEWQKVESSH